MQYETGKEKISILVMTYFHEQYIRECLESIFCQEVDIPFEVVVSDDASGDGTVGILREYEKQHQNLRVLTSEVNLGLFGNYKKCLDACDGLYFAQVAGDDYWTDPFKLQKQLDFLRKNPDYGLVHTDNSVMFEDNGEIVVSRHSTWKTPIPSGNVYRNLLTDNFIGALTIFSYTRILQEAGRSIQLFQSSWQMEDYPLWLEIASKYKIGYLPDITAMHRYNRHSLSNPQDRRKNFKLILSSYEIRFYFLERDRDKLDPDFVKQIRHNYQTFIFERSFILKDRELIELIRGETYSPGTVKERMYYLSAKVPIFAGLLRVFLQLKQMLIKH